MYSGVKRDQLDCSCIAEHASIDNTRYPADPEAQLVNPIDHGRQLNAIPFFTQFHPYGTKYPYLYHWRPAQSPPRLALYQQVLAMKANFEQVK
jgi:hypothetical protein